MSIWGKYSTCISHPLLLPFFHMLLKVKAPTELLFTNSAKVLSASLGSSSSILEICSGRLKKVTLQGELRSSDSQLMVF